MMMRVRAGFTVIAMLAVMGLAGCGHYICSAGFGSSTCTSSGPPSLGGGGGTSNVATAYVYAIDQAGSIDSYTLNTTAGTFAATPSYTGPEVPTNNGGVGMVVAQEQYVYAGFGSIGQLYGWTIDSTTGALTAISGSPYSAPFLANYGVGVGQGNMITNPAGTMLFISDTTQSGIYAYTIGAGGVLTLVTGSPFAVPFEPMNLATDGLGKYLYAINGNFDTHTGSEIAAFTINNGTTSPGALTPVVGSPFITAGNANYSMWQLAGEPTGNFLIGASGRSAVYSGSDDDHLYVFSITQSGASAGAITPVGTPVVTAYSPFSIAMQSNTGGSLLYSFSFNDTATGFNGVEGYEISSTGALTAVAGSPFSNVAEGTWGQFDQSGAYLFVWGTFFDEGSNAQVTQLGPNDVGSGGLLTEPIPLLTLPNSGFWVVTDPQ
jgi:6-phosphogluconolactonase